MGPITEAVHKMINEREAEGLAKYGRHLDHDSPIDALLELGRELADAPQYYQLHLHLWRRLQTLLLEWHEQGHTLPAEALQIISRNTPAETLEVSTTEMNITPQQQHKNKWHKVSEEIPPTGTRLLVADRGGVVCAADYHVRDGRREWNFDGNANFVPVVWQLCPEFDPDSLFSREYAYTWVGKGRGLLPDCEIAALCEGNDAMIYPFVDHQVRVSRDKDNAPIISYGLSSAGYDMRLAPESYVITSVYGCINPKHPANINSETPARHADGGLIIPPNRTLIGTSIERFKLPPDVMCIIVGKSTYARCGIHVLTTPAEPEWEGHLTLEISNLNPESAIVYPYEGIAQCLFFRLTTRPNVTYADRNGKYQNQPPRPIASRL